MTRIELKPFRRALEARQAQLEALMRNRGSIAAGAGADLFDQIQNASESDLAMGELERVSAGLHEVRAALDRVDAGKFGWCLGCEEALSLKRLAAMPWAALCVVCREAADRRAALPGMAMGGPLLDAS